MVILFDNWLVLLVVANYPGSWLDDSTPTKRRRWCYQCSRCVMIGWHHTLHKVGSLSIFRQWMTTSRWCEAKPTGTVPALLPHLITGIWSSSRPANQFPRSRQSVFLQQFGFWEKCRLGEGHKATYTGPKKERYLSPISHSIKRTAAAHPQNNQRRKIESDLSPAFHKYRKSK